MKVTVAGRALVVVVAGSRFALPLERVVEIVRMVALVPLPDSAPWLLGMADVRGDHVPVVSLGLRLGLDATPPGLDTRIVIVNATCVGGTATAGASGTAARVGLAVDEASGITDVDGNVLAPSPSPLAPRSFRDSGGNLVMLLDDAVLEVTAGGSGA